MTTSASRPCGGNTAGLRSSSWRSRRFDHCRDRIATRIPIASIDTTPKTDACPIGDELLQQGGGQTFVLNTALWAGLAPSVRATLAPSPPMAPPIAGAGSRHGVIVGCPTAHDVELLWVDVTDVRQPKAWRSNPNDGGARVRFYGIESPPASSELPSSPEPSPPLPPVAVASVKPGLSEAPGTPAWVVVDPPTCEMGRAPAGVTRWVGRELQMDEGAERFERRTLVLDIRGSVLNAREFTESADPHGNPIGWTCDWETTLTGEASRDRDWLKLRARGEVLWQCAPRALAVARSDAVWRDAGDAVYGGRDLRWTPRPVRQSMVLVCNENAVFAPAPGVEAVRASMAPGIGDHHFRYIAVDGSSHPYLPQSRPPVESIPPSIQ